MIPGTKLCILMVKNNSYSGLQLQTAEDTVNMNDLFSDVLF